MNNSQEAAKAEAERRYPINEHTGEVPFHAKMRRSAFLEGAEWKRSQTTVASVEELQALPEGSVILDSFGDVSQLRDGFWCSYESNPFTSEWAFRKYSPITILYVGKLDD